MFAPAARPPDRLRAERARALGRRHDRDFRRRGRRARGLRRPARGGRRGALPCSAGPISSTSRRTAARAVASRDRRRHGCARQRAQLHAGRVGDDGGRAGVTGVRVYSFSGLVVGAVLASALIMTAVSFVLVGSSPRSVGRAHSTASSAVLGARSSAPSASSSGRSPTRSSRSANRVTPGRDRRIATFSSEEQLLSMVDEATELDVLEEDDRELIHSIFEFNDTVVREVMVPRTDMITVDGDDGLDTRWRCSCAEGCRGCPCSGRTSTRSSASCTCGTWRGSSSSDAGCGRAADHGEPGAQGAVRARVEEGGRHAAADAGRVEPPRDGGRRVRRHRRPRDPRGPHRGTRRRYLRRVRP